MNNQLKIALNTIQVLQRLQTNIKQFKLISLISHPQMKHPYIPEIPLAKSTQLRDLNKKTNHNLSRQRLLSSQNINHSSDLSNQSGRKNQQPDHSLDHQLLRQLAQDYENISKYKVNGKQPNDYEEKLIKKHKKGIISQQNYQSTSKPPLNSHMQKNSKKYYQQSNNNQMFNNKQRFTDPLPFQQNELPDTMGDQQEEYIEHIEPQRSKSARNLRSLKEKQIKNSGDIQNNRQNQYYNPQSRTKDTSQDLQHRAIYQNFRRSDLNFLSDQQFLPQGMYPQLFAKKSISNKNSKKSESVHPVFRDTLEYVDLNKFNIHQRFAQYHRQEDRTSDQSSQSSTPLTNIDNQHTFKGKYKKYKQKYMNTVDVVRQFQTLNETLINDQRQNFLYYEDTIRNLENLLVVKDKQIQQLNKLLIASKGEEDRFNNGICSIEGRQLEIDNRRLKKQIDGKDKEINVLKQSILTITSASRVTQKNKEGTSKNLQRKNELLKKQKQSFLKKIASLDQLNRTYEQKLRDKQERLNKLFQMNSELQQQNIKLKGKIQSEETYDTERPFGGNLSKKTKKDQLSFSTQTFSKFPVISSQQKAPSPSEIQKYLACIDQQLQMIRSSVVSRETKEDIKDVKIINHLKKKQMSDLDLVSEFQFEESLMQTSQKIPYKELQNVVQKLSDFRASMGV